MNKSDFQDLADLRIEEARVLLDQGKFDGAYYLAGYAVECALKACIAKLIKQYDFPDKDVARKYYTHDFEILLSTAKLDSQRELDNQADLNLRRNWAVLKDWSEMSRYIRKSQSEAEALYEAISDANHGVLPWIKQHW